jgi:sec-independent protein translocase protein TatA
MQMGELSPWHLLILAAVFVLLFGARRLPDAARSLGKSLRILKTEVKGLHDDEDQPATPPQQPAPVASLPASTQDATATAAQQTPAAGDRSDTR